MVCSVTCYVSVAVVVSALAVVIGHRVQSPGEVAVAPVLLQSSMT